MNVEEALRIVKAGNEKRYPHVYSTYLKALYLAEKYKLDTYKTGIAAIFHDYAKNMDMTEMMEIIKNHLDPELLKYDEAVYHGFVGAYVVEHKIGITDPDIINAVKYHVTGHPDMNDIAKAVYVADFIEDLREHSGVNICRCLADISLDLGVLGCAERTMQFLYENDRNSIHPLTLATYNSFLEKVGKEYYDTVKNNCECL